MTWPADLRAIVSERHTPVRLALHHSSSRAWLPVISERPIVRHAHPLGQVLIVSPNAFVAIWSASQ